MESPRAGWKSGGRGCERKGEVLERKDGLESNKICAGLKTVQLGRCISLWTKCSEIYRERWKRPFAKRQCGELCIEIIFNKVKRVATSLKVLDAYHSLISGHLPGYVNTDLRAQLYMCESKRSGVGGLVYLLCLCKCLEIRPGCQKAQITAVIVAC